MPTIVNETPYADKLHKQLVHSGWAPPTEEVLRNWIVRELNRAQATPQVFLPVIQEFKDLIETDPNIYMHFIQMFKEVPQPAKVPDYQTMLVLLNQAIRRIPTYDPNEEFSGLYIHAVLMAVIVTEAGYDAFINDKVNAQFKKILTVWRDFLMSSSSAEVLGTEPGQWLSPSVIKIFETYVGDFVAAFECNPDEPHWGFGSWDHFFIRAFRPGVRPLEFPEDPNVINSACESTVYRIATDVKEYDEFWLKQQNYSLRHMLDSDPFAPKFNGGTVYQAFLSTTDYHRWHSPVTGTVIKAYVVPGTYYALSPALRDDHAILTATQAYLSVVATRALVFIESENPLIGLMCFIAVGMIEVSSCDITVRQGDRVKRGDQLGTFHYGGSTHCLVFRPETKLDFVVNEETGHVPLRSAIARVST